LKASITQPRNTARESAATPVDCECGLEWRCADSLAPRNFLRLGDRKPVPDHSCPSSTRARLPLDVHEAAFTWVLQRLAERGLLRGERIGVDASTMGTSAASLAIIRWSYRDMLARMAKESGIKTPVVEDLIRLARARKGKELSNAVWEGLTDADARVATFKDGSTHFAYKPEHAVDLDSGAVVAAEMHPAERGNTMTLPSTLEVAARYLGGGWVAPSAEALARLVAYKGHHSRDTGRRSTTGHGRSGLPGRAGWFPALARG
jgi:hypothetical protein